MAIGNPISLTNNIAEKTSSQIAAAGQGQFIVPGGYLINKLGVYRNGVKLSQSSDYTANDGDTVNLIVPANDGDVIQFQVFDYFNVADAITAEGGTVVGTLIAEGSIVANGGVTGDLTGDVTGDISGATATFTGDVSIGGTLTYEDVTNIDSVGIITARSGVHVTGGDVGIGTDSPTGRLEVKKDGTTEAIQIWRSDMGTNNRTVVFYSPDTDSSTEPFYWSTGNSFAWKIDGSERMRIASDGNVGIGTSIPSAKLHIFADSATAQFRLSHSDDIASYYAIGRDSSGNLRINDSANGELIRIQPSGNVGINEISPEERLQVDGNIRVSSTNQYLKFTAGNTQQSGLLAIAGDPANNRAGINFQGVASNQKTAITFSTSDTVSTMAERMRIDDDGNVGIGTSIPAGKLHVTAGTSARFFIEGSNGRSEIRANSGNLSFFTNEDANPSGANNTIFYNSSNESMRINSSGDVGIGTNSPNEKLEVIGNIRAQASDSSSGAQMESGGALELWRSDGVAFIDFKTSTSEDFDCRIQQASDGLSFATGGNGSSTERMRIDSSGNFGIGTNSPEEKLHVREGDVVIGQASGANTGIRNYVKFGRDGSPKAAIGFINNLSNGRGDLLFMNDAVSDGSQFSDADEVMRIDSSGNVGIATDNPTEKLHVIGNILASGNITAFSDIKLKDNIEVIPNALDKLVQIRGVTFDRIDEEVPRQSGVIAQEVEKVLPEVVITNKDGIKSVAYGNLVGLLIESIKELKVEVNELKARLEE
jgi:hypothetical protein